MSEHRAKARRGADRCGKRLGHAGVIVGSARDVQSRVRSEPLTMRASRPDCRGEKAYVKDPTCACSQTMRERPAHEPKDGFDVESHDARGRNLH